MLLSAWLFFFCGEMILALGYIVEPFVPVEVHWIEEVFEITAFFPLLVFVAYIASPMRILILPRARTRRYPVLGALLVLGAAAIAFAPWIFGLDGARRNPASEDVLHLSQVVLDMILLEPIALVLLAIGVSGSSRPYVFLGIGLVLLLPEDLLNGYLPLHAGELVGQYVHLVFVVSQLYILNGALLAGSRRRPSTRDMLGKRRPEASGLTTGRRTVPSVHDESRPGILRQGLRRRSLSPSPRGRGRAGTAASRQPRRRALARGLPPRLRPPEGTLRTGPAHQAVDPHRAARIRCVPGSGLGGSPRAGRRPPGRHPRAARRRLRARPGETAAAPALCTAPRTSRNGSSTLTGGCTVFSGNYSKGAAQAVLPYLLGSRCTESGADAATMKSSAMVILWGANVLDTRLGSETPKRLLEAKRRGVPIVAIDPRRTATVRHAATWWIPCRPGTDAALMLAVLHVLLSERLVDLARIGTLATGFDSLARSVLGQDGGAPRTPGVGRDDLRGAGRGDRPLRARLGCSAPGHAHPRLFHPEGL